MIRADNNPINDNKILLYISITAKDTLVKENHKEYKLPKKTI